MKIAIALPFISILFICACTSAPQKQVDAPTAASPQSAPTARNYRCKSGETVSTTYPSTDSATVQYKGMGYKMHIAVSGSGARYVGGGLEWWTKGTGAGALGLLLRHQSDGTSGAIMERCTEY
ncbi:MAG: MliC family protein [Nitrococcus sp.]|nr:MliC family protein [Nitrococcus sp.]